MEASVKLSSEENRDHHPEPAHGALPGPGRALWVTLGWSLLLGVGLSLGAALLDAAVAGSRAGGLSGALVLLALGLHAPVGLGIGLGLGLLWGGARAVLGREQPLDRRLAADPELDLKVAAGLLAGCGALLLVVGLVFAFARGPAAAMANPLLSALSTGLWAAGAVVLALLAWFPLYLGARPLTRLVPRLGSRSLVVAALLAALLLVAALLLLGRVDWRVLRLGGPLLLVALTLLWGAGLLLLLRRRGRGAPRRALWAGALVLGLGLTGAAPLLGGDITAAGAASEGLLLRPLLGAGRALGDGDGDGYSAWFAGGDCDDSRADVHPGARDVPGNGVDENCMGGDARPKRARAKKAKAAASAATAAKGPSFSPAKNLLLICIDTLRADKVGVYGHTGGLTPNLDALARTGVVYRRALAHGPNTPQSFPSIFTSRYPTRVPFYKRFTGYPRIKPEAVTFFEVMQGAGLHTAAVTSHFYFKPRRGITQGVAEWDNRDAKNIKESNKDIASPRIVPRALAKLDELAASGERFALFVHLFEPHSTYVRHTQFPITRRGVAGLQQKYDYEIKFSDLWLGKLLAGLKERGLAQNTAVVVFGDHGEAFAEHRFYFHGQALYNEVLHVPLVVAAPGLAARQVEAWVGLIDIAPTLLELLGLEPPETFEGRSLVPQALGQPAPADRALGAVLMRYPAWPKGQRAMILGKYKAIQRLDENRFELYDLEQDPREQNDLARTDPALAKTWQQKLNTFIEQELQ